MVSPSLDDATVSASAAKEVAWDSSPSCPFTALIPSSACVPPDEAAPSVLAPGCNTCECRASRTASWRRARLGGRLSGGGIGGGLAGGCELLDVIEGVVESGGEKRLRAGLPVVVVWLRS